ncbi:hypothetical protein ACIRYZ_23560 [Kitasatospora sp. NPDC101155]|uniref:hypothetical protein n=1 Tax=Kitasatospora sp. NPDC101155 TaxID=3364097 RepID=UPI00380B7293
MSATSERNALGPRMSLYDHATRLLQQTPDGPLPEGGRPFPDEPDQPSRTRSRRGEWQERRAGLGRLLEAFFADPDSSLDTLRTKLCELDVSDRMIFQVLESLPAPDPHRAVDIGTALLRTGTDRRTVWLGLSLLAITRGPADTELIRTLGLLMCCSSRAIAALASMPGTTPDLIWLAERLPARRRSEAVTALCARADEPQAREWLLHTPPDEWHTAPSQAREIAEAVHLAEALDRSPDNERILEQAARLLAAMTGANDYRAPIRKYSAARQVYSMLADRADRLPPSLDRYALLVSLVLDLDSGHSNLLGWPPGEWEKTLDRLRALLGHPRWTAQITAARTSQDAGARWRAAWIDRIPKKVLTGGSELSGPRDRLAVHVCVLDPVGRGGVETRVLVDGRPVIAEAFDRGVAHSPERLLGTGQLRAAEEPREVQLAEAWCTEGCCGALYVTIVRDRDTVLWRNWRRPPAPKSEPPLPELPDLRFDAAQYDAEIARAENDHSWEWPARTLARLIREQLGQQPDLLAQWSCQRGWIGTHYAQRDQVELSFTYPERPRFGSDKNPWVQFIWTIPDNGTPPEEQANAVLRQLAAASPTTYARLAGGSREAAEALGFTWPPETD